ncbi:LysR family transcriptional regulator [Prosthecomicrobium pneumaticum]|uniref:DNA-binding transcriptional LysR family regulator n=1 Tax=Prosthecomicrobium pneumaticum TaxID=81895 RepID=A0A7W9CV33_9HYPH|nr:LysR family transcriptional regulator [Prosthecomicrobium pneumaticum]MBB5751907.1 DNA-binding transcriptional LysR family regulator [Prosthecomicrobium pneumaticum]
MNPLRYDLVDLRLYVAIAEAGNLTRGAERAHLSVGAASMRIKNLEEALDTQLFTRSSQGVSPTPAGEALLAHAHRIFREIERLHGGMQAFSRGVKGKVRMFANTTAISEILPAALGRFLAAHPQVDIELEERLSPEIARAVADGGIDIGILAGTVQTDGLDVLPYQRDRLVLAVARDHELARRGRIDFAEALPLNFVSLQRDSAIHGFTEKIAADLGASLSIRIRVSGFESLCRMVEADVGVGLLPGSVADRLAASHAIAILELTDPWALRELKICVRKLDELPAFARALVDHLIGVG